MLEKMKKEIIDWLDKDVLIEGGKHKDLTVNIMQEYCAKMKKSEKPESNKDKAKKVTKLLESES